MTSMSLNTEAQQVKADVLEFIENTDAKPRRMRRSTHSHDRFSLFSTLITCSIARIACLAG